MRNKRLIILLSVLGGIALIIIIGSVIFSVYTVEASCKNTIDRDLNAQVVEASGISFTSIFLVNEKNAVENVNNNVVRAEMINVERIFPNKVMLHYNKIYTDISFKYSGETYYASDTGKIIGSGPSLVSDQGDPASPISVILGQAPISTAAGWYLNESGSEDMTALEVVIRGLKRLWLKGQDSQPFKKEQYSTIDLSGPDVIITTATGVVFELRCHTETRKRAGAEVMLEQLGKAVSMYISGSYSITSGRYIVTHSLEGSYSPTLAGQ